MWFLITMLFFRKDMEGAISPGSLSFQPGCDHRKAMLPAASANGSESTSKLRNGPGCHAHFKLVTLWIH